MAEYKPLIRLRTRLVYNWNILGHKKQLKFIEEDIKSGNLAHAYLFSGPSSVGKFSIARRFVNIMQCPNNLCNECPTCKQIQSGNHPDTIVLKEKDESIKIEQIRDIIQRLQMTKQAKYKILLIKGAERLTPEAANCLLKTLEEPPPNTFIIMTTSSIREILPTIISRVRIIKFTAYSQKFLEEKLAEMYPDKDADVIKQVSSLAIGKSGKAIKLLQNSELLASYLNMYNVLCEFLEDKPVYKKFQVIGDILNENDNAYEFLDIFTHLVRSRLHQGIAVDTIDQSKKEHLVDLLSEIQNTRSLLKRNINARLALENLALKAFK